VTLMTLNDDIEVSSKQNKSIWGEDNDLRQK